MAVTSYPQQEEVVYWAALAAVLRQADTPRKEVSVKPCKCGNRVASNARFCPHCGHRFTHPFVMLIAVLFGVFIALGILGVIVASSVGGSGSSVSSNLQTGTTAPAETPGQTKKHSETRAATNKRFEACRAKLKKAKKLDLLYDMSWESPSEPRVIVGPTFFTIPIDAKEGFADTVNCFLTAANGHCVNFDLRSWNDGKSVARYSYCQLKMN